MIGPRYVLALAAAALLALCAPAAASAVTLETTGARPFEGGLVSLPGERVGAVARVQGAPAGSTLTLTLEQHGRVLRTERRTVSGAGAASAAVRPVRAGTLRVHAVLSAPGGGSATADEPATATVAVLRPTSSAGARGLHVRFLQSRLAAMAFAVRRTGVHDAHTSNAVIAHRKVLRFKRTGIASAAVFRAAAAGRGAYAARYPRAGRHVEADLTRQVLALVDSGGRVHRVYHTSSGRPRFKTPTGVHRFWRKEFGMNSRSMLHTVYFTRDKTTPPTRPACGIHGYFAVPTYPYSHCCFRVPLADAFYIYRWTRVGQRIHVYRS